MLDDDSRRLGSMQVVLDRDFGDYLVVLHDSAPDMLAWLKKSWDEVCLLSLDHDLGPSRNDGTFEPGTGADVSRFLLTRTPAFPVILHSSNPMAVQGMESDLLGAGWVVTRVTPYFDLEWIERDWRAAGLRALGIPVNLP